MATCRSRVIPPTPANATIAGLGLWLSLLLKSAFALVGFGAYLYVFAALPLRPVALALLVLIVVLNILGIKKVGKAQIVMVGISLVGLVALAGVAGSTHRPAAAYTGPSICRRCSPHSTTTWGST